MKRFATVAVVAIVAATTLGVPARAEARVVDCTDHLFVQEEAGFQSFTINLQTLEVRIQPGAVGDDALMLVDYYGFDGVNFALCAEGGLVTGPVFCFLGRLDEIISSLDPMNGYLRYVYQDPNTGEIVIDGGRLVADLNC